MPLRIAITGPESSGKSTLAKSLALSLGGIFVPEYAREYLLKLPQGFDQYSLDDIVNIAQGQCCSEDNAAAQNPNTNYLLCDTDPLVCKIWAEVKFGTCPAELETLFQQRHYDLTLLCAPDIPWEYDPLREAPNAEERWRLFELYEQTLINAGKKYSIITGLYRRETDALKTIASV